MHPTTMGLRPLGLEDWLPLEVDDRPKLAERARIIAAHAEDVVGLIPAGEAAVEELASLVEQRNIAVAPPGPPRDRLVAMGHGIVEDLCVMVPAPDGPFILGAAVMCFPNRWRMREKLGKNLLGIHGPVPEYAAKLASPVDRFLTKLRPMRLFKRENWGICIDDTLYLPDATPPVDPLKDKDWHFRREEQSFLKLPVTGAVLFSIRTTLTHWTKLPAEKQAEIRADVHSLSPDWMAYKSLTARA